MNTVRKALLVVGIVGILWNAAGEVRAYQLPDNFCHVFTANLSLGSTDPDVVYVRQILNAEGLLPNSEAFGGTYDTTLARAVQAYQERYAATILKPNKLTRGTGVLGAATRTKLNSSYGCTPTQIAALKPIVIPPPSISTVRVSNPITIRRNTNGDTTMASFEFTFTVNNSEDTPVYISKDITKAAAIISNLDNASTRITSIYSPDTVSVDGTDQTYYVAPKSSRRFIIGAVLNNVGNPYAPTNAYLNISRIFYSTTTQTLDLNTASSLYTRYLQSGNIQLGS